jgi:hypothetical protein
MKPLIWGAEKRFIFHARAGQEFANAARRANHLTQQKRKVAAAQHFSSTTCENLFDPRLNSGRPRQSDLRASIGWKINGLCPFENSAFNLRSSGRPYVQIRA